PVVFVHGIGGNASDFEQHRNYFIDHGYSSDELYATTYGDPSLIDLWNMTLSCTFFRQFHDFIVAIAKYARSKVDVVGYSGGALIARKAILGGMCADTDENIGSNLTSLVSCFRFCSIIIFSSIRAVDTKGNTFCKQTNPSPSKLPV
ncbi:hypothetical protein Tcan_02105, partial [Toxocara canis]